MGKISVPNGRGFDIVIWQRKSGPEEPVYASAYTLQGRIHLGNFLKKVAYKMAYCLDGIHPDELLRNTAGKISIGGVSPGSRAPVLINPPLH